MTILVKPGSRSVMNEAFRVVRTNIEFMENTTQGPRIIMFTSMNPGSGKTFLTMNIATSFAIKGKKVIALDLDLRRASLSEYVESPKQGLSEYLNGTLEDWTALKVPVEGVDNLEVLPVGTIPPNPAELLFSPRLQPLMDQLSTRYDMIFLDCPPVEIVADASVIAQYANLTVFVVRANLMELRFIMRPVPETRGERKEVIWVPDPQMEDFIRVTSERNEKVLYLNNLDFALRPGARVQVKDGPFAGVQGIVKSIQKHLCVVLPVGGVVAVAILNIPKKSLIYLPQEDKTIKIQ